MKRAIQFKYLIIYFLALLCSCSKNDYSPEFLETKKAQVEDFSKFGEMHNNMLQNMKDNYVYNDDLMTSSRDEKISYFLSLNMNYVDFMDIDIQSKKELKSQMSFFRNLLDATTFSPFQKSMSSRSCSETPCSLNESFKNDSILTVENINNLVENLAYAHENKLIPEQAFITISEIIELLEKGNDGLIPDAVLEEKIDEIISNVNDMNLDESDSSLLYIAPILIIAQYSLDWWKENPDAMSSDEGKIAPFVYSDAAGAIEGIVAYALTTNNTNLVDAGWSALAGGALGSIGLGGRVVKYFRKFFK